MLIIDAHCDTASVLLDNKEDFFENNKSHVTLKKLMSNDKDERLQFFAAFADPDIYRGNELSRVLSIIDYVYEAEKRYGDKLKICFNAHEVEETVNSHKIAALLSVEGGEALCGQLSILRQLYRLGVRSMLLTWNYRNLLADGATEKNGKGISEFGRQVVCEMNRLGMLVDVSHLCEAGFYDVLEASDAPVIASHSNSRAVCDNVRNLDDRQLEALKRNGGVIGINLYPYFINNTEKATIDEAVKHIEHICSLTGEDHIGLGADFDGIDCTTEALEGPHKIYNLFERLLQLNYSESFIEKFAGLNFMRIIKHVLK